MQPCLSLLGGKEEQTTDMMKGVHLSLPLLCPVLRTKKELVRSFDVCAGAVRQRAQPRPTDLIQDDQPELAEHQPDTVQCYTPVSSAGCCNIWTGASLHNLITICDQVMQIQFLLTLRP